MGFVPVFHQSSAQILATIPWLELTTQQLIHIVLVTISLSAESHTFHQCPNCSYYREQWKYIDFGDH